MRRGNRTIFGTTARERRLIEQQTARPVFERLDAGELEIVDMDDWSGVTEIEASNTLTVPTSVYKSLKAASRKRHTSPDRLAARLLAKSLKA
jgi:hypothetical protein